MLFAVYTTMKKVTRPNKLYVLIRTAMSVPSLKIFLETFMHRYNVPRFLHSATDYGRNSCFEHLIWSTTACTLYNSQDTSFLV